MARKATALAQRRERDHVDIQAAVTGGNDTVCTMPASVEKSPRVKAAWISLVGSGATYTQADAPIIEQLAFNYVLMEDCRAQLMDENGNTMMYITRETDEGLKVTVENPAYKTLSKLTQDTLKLADVLGLTPAARLKFGLTQANTNALNVSIADTIYKALQNV